LDRHRVVAAAVVVIDGAGELGDRECGRAGDSGDGGGGEYFHDTHTWGCAVADDDWGNLGRHVAGEGRADHSGGAVDEWGGVDVRGVGGGLVEGGLLGYARGRLTPGHRGRAVGGLL